MRTTKEIYKEISELINKDEGALHRRCGMPVLKRLNGKMMITVFASYFNDEELDSLSISRPSDWIILNIEDGKIINAFNCDDVDDYTTIPRDEKVNIDPTTCDEIPDDYLDKAFAVFDDIRLQIIEDNEFNPFLYNQYMNYIFRYIPKDMHRLYKKLSIALPCVIDADLRINVDTWLPTFIKNCEQNEETAVKIVKYFDSLPVLYTLLSIEQGDYTKRTSCPFICERNSETFMDAMDVNEDDLIEVDEEELYSDFSNESEDDDFMPQGKVYVCQDKKSAKELAKILGLTLSDGSVLIGELRKNDMFKNLENFTAYMQEFGVLEIAFGATLSEQDGTPVIEHAICCVPEFVEECICQDGRFLNLKVTEEEMNYIKKNNSIQMMSYDFVPPEYRYDDGYVVLKDIENELNRKLFELISKYNKDKNESEFFENIELDTLCYLGHLCIDRETKKPNAFYKNKNIVYDLFEKAFSNPTGSDEDCLFIEKLRDSDVLYFLLNEDTDEPFLTESQFAYVFTNIDLAHIALREINDMESYKVGIGCVYNPGFDGLFEKLFYESGIKGIVLDAFLCNFGVKSSNILTPLKTEKSEWMPNDRIYNSDLKRELIYFSQEIESCVVYKETVSKKDNIKLEKIYKNVLRQIMESRLLFAVDAKNNNGSHVTTDKQSGYIEVTPDMVLELPCLVRKDNDGKEVKILQYFTDWEELYKQLPNKHMFANLKNGNDLYMEGYDAIAINPGSKHMIEIPMSEYLDFVKKK